MIRFKKIISIFLIALFIFSSTVYADNNKIADKNKGATVTFFDKTLLNNIIIVPLG